MSEPTISQLFDLTGKVALITGGTGYLGSAMARALAEAGASVVISSREASRAESAAAALPRPHEQPHFGVELDHKDEDSIRRGFQGAVAKTGHVDVLVNNGQGGPPNDWTDVTAEQFNDQLANAAGYFVLARQMREHAVARQTPSSIILIGSMYGVVGSYPDAYAGVCPASPVAYHTLKGGIVHMTRHLAVYWAPDNIRVNCLSPGPFPAEKAPAEMVERLKKKSPMGRMGKSWELKGAVVFLASEASGYMTGQNLIVDGGWTAW